jgi:hypothetical protein
MLRSLSGLAGIALLASAALAETKILPDGMVMREFGQTAAAAPGPKGADQVLMFERDSAGQLTVAGLALVPDHDWQLSAPASTIAVMRSRSKNAEKKERPDAEDRRFASGQTFPIYVLGEWSNPATLWEIDPAAKPMRFRAIGEDGRPGDWSKLPE